MNGEEGGGSSPKLVAGEAAIETNQAHRTLRTSVREGPDMSRRPRGPQESLGAIIVATAERPRKNEAVPAGHSEQGLRLRSEFSRK